MYERNLECNKMFELNHLAQEKEKRMQILFFNAAAGEIENNEFKERVQ